MQPYQHILVGADFSASAEAALQRAILLASSEAKVSLLHVVEHFPEDISSELISPEDEDPAKFIQDQARQRLSAMAETFHAEGVEQKVVMSTGSARAAILAEAERTQVDLIMVGANGGRGMAGLLGSTAIGVTQSAPCDVLVVRG
jgi:nucleotide-binding universal stress UspA family protein